METVIKTSTLMVPQLGTPTEWSKEIPYSFCIHLDSKNRLARHDMDLLLTANWTHEDYKIELAIDGSNLDELYLVAITTTNKGNGLGSELLTYILDHCDNIGKNLRLIPIGIEDASRINKKYRELQDVYGNDYALQHMPSHLSKAVRPRIKRLIDWYLSFDGMELQSDGSILYTA